MRPCRPWCVCRTPGDDVVLHEGRARIWRQYTVNVGDIDAAWQAAYTRTATFAVHRHTGIHWKRVVWLPAIMPTVAN